MGLTFFICFWAVYKLQHNKQKHSFMIHMTYSKTISHYVADDSDFRLKCIKNKKRNKTKNKTLCAESQSPPICWQQLGFSVKDGLGSDQDAYFLEIRKVSKSWIIFFLKTITFRMRFVQRMKVTLWWITKQKLQAPMKTNHNESQSWTD